MTANLTPELDQVRSEVRDHYAQRAQTAQRRNDHRQLLWP